MTAEKKKQAGVLSLIVALVIVLFGSILFVGATSGWFDNDEAILDNEYICQDNCDGEYTELDAAGYEDLIGSHKSFLVFVDQPECTTADRLRTFLTDYAKERQIRPYRMLFSETKNSSLHDSVKYYPSVAIISKGKVIGAMQADSDADAPAYNDYGAFKEWISRYLKVPD